MIYFDTKDGKHVLILNPSDIANLMLGEMCINGAKNAVVCYTPDEPWMVAQLKAIFDQPNRSLDPLTFDKLLAEGLERAQVKP